MKKTLVFFALFLFVSRLTEAKIFLSFDTYKPFYYTYFDGNFSVFDILEDKEVFSYKFDSGGDILYAGFQKNSETLNIVFSSGGIFSCQVYSNNCFQTYPSSDVVFSYYLPLTQHLIVQHKSGKTDFIDTSSYKIDYSTNISPDITSIALISVREKEKKNFIAGLSDGTILLWSVMGRGILAKTAIPTKQNIIYIREFSYSEILPGFDDKNPDIKKIKQKSGILALSSDGTFYTFSLDKKDMKYYLKPLSEYKTGLDSSFKPVEGLSSSDYIVFSNPYGKLHFFAFKTRIISYKDKEFDKLIKDLGIPEESKFDKLKIALPEIEEKSTEDLGLKEPSYMVLSFDGKYILCANEKGKKILKRNPLIEKMFNKIIEKGDLAVQSKKYDLAITLYSKALDLYPDKSIEEKREKVWELKRKDELERFEKFKRTNKGIKK